MSESENPFEELAKDLINKRNANQNRESEITSLRRHVSDTWQRNFNSLIDDAGRRLRPAGLNFNGVHLALFNNVAVGLRYDLLGLTRTYSLEIVVKEPGMVEVGLKGREAAQVAVNTSQTFPTDQFASVIAKVIREVAL